MQNAEARMNKAIAALQNDLAAIRAGRANPAILDKITVEYYGVATPVQQVGTVAVPEPRTITIQPWDASILGEIEKAILKSDIGLTPNNDGKMIRLNFPPLTEERRKELVKGISKRGEECKVAVRNVRRDANDAFKKLGKSSEVSEDEQKQLEEEIQKVTDKYIAEIDKVTEAKSKEILTV